MKFSKHNSKLSRTRGVTLIELLVVVAIMSVLTAIMIPRLRVINKDRNIREAARVVGSMLAKVNARAIDEGVSGMIIERNQNFVDANGVQFAGTRLYVMRKIPPYSGDDAGDEAEVVMGGIPGETMDVEIDTPLEHTATHPLIEAGDQIRLNNNSVIYDISDVTGPTGGKLTLELSLGLNAAATGAIRPTLADGDYPYVIYRQPRKLESSRIDLPNGYYIDLRLSGPLVPTPAAPPIAPDWVHSTEFDYAVDGDVRLAFNQDGSINRWGVFDSTGALASSGIPQDAFYFFVTAYEPESTTPVLQSPSAMWVTIDKATGSVNVASNVQPPGGLSVFDTLKYTRGFGQTRQSANQ